jgi:hypothetical protein
MRDSACRSTTILTSQSLVDTNYPGSPRTDAIAPQLGIGCGYDRTNWTAPPTFAIVTGGEVTQVVTRLAPKVLARSV